MYAVIKRPNYGIFVSGNCSKPYRIGLKNWDNNEVISQIWLTGDSTKDVMTDYDKKSNILKDRYKKLLSQ